MFTPRTNKLYMSQRVYVYAYMYERKRARLCAYIDILNYVGVGDGGPGDASATTHREIANGIL